jgi:hypothetical protein
MMMPTVLVRITTMFGMTVIMMMVIMLVIA